MVGFLASLGRKIVRALKGVAEDVKFREVVVVVLVVLATAPELLIAAGVSVAAVRVLTLLLQVLVQVLSKPEGEIRSGERPLDPSERFGALRESYGP